MRRWLRSASRWSGMLMRHRYGLTMVAYLTAATLTGITCVAFMRVFEAVLEHRLDHVLGAWCWVATPALFLAAVELIRRAAPAAAGTGIPQAIFAAKHLSPLTEQRLQPLLAPRTLVVKVVALLIGVLACASTGREGPTVHIAAGVFVGIMWIFHRRLGVVFDRRSAVVAGGAAGLAAAFNTPLAGVTFAVEELTANYFSGIKDVVLLAIVIAALAAKSLTGEYAYFGRLTDPPPIGLGLVAAIGIAGGLLGALFSWAILAGQRLWSRWPAEGWRWLRPAGLALLLLAVARASAADVLGPGNRAAQQLLGGGFGGWAWWFPLQKIAATLCTYWSGIAGGIFAPCLSVGAALGADAASLGGGAVASGALVGMAAFLSGTIQAPITAFVIIFEMTGHHEMLLPVMLGSLLAFMTARVVGAVHLYQALSSGYGGMLPGSSRPTTTAHG
jgi:H+/Cl- antiporter ClcA